MVVMMIVSSTSQGNFKWLEQFIYPIVLWPASIDYLLNNTSVVVVYKNMKKGIVKENTQS